MNTEKSSKNYQSFLHQKTISDPPTGMIDLPTLPSSLFGFQRDIVQWALRRGRAAIFAGTGLGKSLMELSWAQAIFESTGHSVLILTPLAVAAQMVREGIKFGIIAKQCRTQSEVEPGITVTNYQKLQHFDISAFGGVVLDESSILKSLDGKTRAMLIESFKDTPFRLAATATPAPNDFMELGNHAQFLGVMSQTEMLSMFFVHDGGDTQSWRIKGHAEASFWKWMCSWSVMLRKPSDLGYENDGYDLPPLTQIQHVIPADYDTAKKAGLLFPLESATMQERIAAKRATITERVAKAAEVTPHDEPCVWWCHLNTESEALVAAIPGAIEVRGSDSEEEKERKLIDFADGKIRVLVTKPSVAGYGLNWQHCAQTGFVGLNDSFEQTYQSIRRFWRFGQTKPVTVHFIASELDGAVVANLKRKEDMANSMADAMVTHMADLTHINITGSTRMKIEYSADVEMQIPNWMRVA